MQSMWDARSVYGVPPISGGPGLRALKANGEGTAPSAGMTAGTAEAAAGGLAGDPAFWLVALAGAAAVLAIWSMPGE